ncbi:hypothetical protein, partial [Paraburkholderia rhynchosiae]
LEAGVKLSAPSCHLALFPRRFRIVPLSTCPRKLDHYKPSPIHATKTFVIDDVADNNSSIAAASSDRTVITRRPSP